MIIELNNVSIRRNNVKLLKNINWTIKQGEPWAILGLDGAGKTTLVNMINGYIFPSTGELRVLGKQLVNMI